MKIYTKTGDDGETGLWGGDRVPKDSLRVQAYGTVDECNAALGVARAGGINAGLDALLATLQHQLFVLGSDLAAPEQQAKIPRIGEDEIAFIETTIDMLEQELPQLRSFILPGGSAAAAHLHLARTICRRAERWTSSLAREAPVSRNAQIYLNRLSDLLFVAARVANARAGITDVAWEPRKQASA